MKRFLNRIGRMAVEEVEYMELLKKNEYNIPSAKTIREETKKAKEEKIMREVCSINQLIRSASRNGRSKVEFNICKEILSEIRQLYTEAGYKAIVKVIYDQKMVSVTLDWEDNNERN
jgi:hypothetical protein